MNGELLAAIEKKQSTAKKTTKELMTPVVGATANNNAGETYISYTVKHQRTVVLFYMRKYILAMQRT